MGSGAQARRSRVFFALWPDEEVRAALAALAQGAQAQCGGRATPSEKIHLTLFFVGDIETARIAQLETAAASLRTEAFDLVLDRVGHWRHNRIVWAGASACPPALAALAADLKAVLARVDVHGEDRPYAPHVTLVRNAARALTHGTFPRCTWCVREFVLVESVPVTAGVSYDIRVRWPL